MQAPLDYMSIQPGVRSYTSRLMFDVMANNKGGVLGADYFRVVSLEGQEQVSQPYHFTISLRANEINELSASAGTDAFAKAPTQSASVSSSVHGVGSALLGQWAQVTVGYEAYNVQGDAQAQAQSVKPESLTFANGAMPERYFSGIVTSLSQGAPGEYTAQLMSPLHPMTLRNQYTVHKNMTIADLIAELLKPELLRYGAAFTLDCSRIQGVSASRTQDWLQAGETDFSMLQRVLTKAAVYFYFVHDVRQLTLVFSNQPTAPNAVTIPGCADGELDLRYSYTDMAALSLQQGDLFCGLNYKVEMVPAGIETVLVKQPASWETNEIASYDSHPVSSQRNSDSGNYIFYKNFAYGVNQEESKEVQQQLLQEAATGQGTLTGQCTSTLLSPGYTFTLKQMALNPTDPTSMNSEATAQNLMPFQFSDQVFVVTKISHKITEHTPYSGSVEATSVALDQANTDGATLLTPLSIHDTHQGSVLATVVASAVPKSVYFMEKGDFSTEVSSVDFDGSVGLKQIGCVVKFATDEGSDRTHWVALSDSSQNAPAVNSIVMVGRGSNESEIPQIQQVVSSHGQKTIQPALWRNNSWTFNTSWGSSCSTSYGDSMSIHFGNEATPDLKTAMNIVQTAYKNPTVMKANFGGVSYNMGCSFSYSTTGKGAKGLASASVSQGSHFSESHSDQDYSISYSNTRQSFSKSNKSVNVSYQGSFTDTVDESNLNFINGKIPNQEIIDICDSLPDGSSYNQSHVTGKTINLSGTGTPPPSAPTVINVQAYSHSITHGDSKSISKQVGNTTSTSTFDGDKSDTSTVTGSSKSVSTVTGDSTSTSTFGGAKSDTSIVMGATESMSTFQGAKSDTSIVMGATESLSTFQGAKLDTSMVMGDAVSMSTFQGAKSDTSMVMGGTESMSTFMGAKSDTSMVMGAAASDSTFMGAKSDISSVMGATESTSSFLGAKTDNNSVIGLSMNSITKAGLETELKNVGGLKTYTEDVGGVCVDTKNGAAATHTDERPQTKQIMVTNITVEGVLSIL